jgi:ABC-type Fe3+ transport system permease subunit
MTLAAACGWSLVRGLAVALAAWPVCRRLAAWLKGLDDRQRRLAWFLLVIPFLCPELWMGYAWSGFALRLAGIGIWDRIPDVLSPSPQAIVTRDAAVDELLLDLLLFLRAVPVGTLVIHFAPPPPLSAEALYCRQLALGNVQRSLGFPARALHSRAEKPMLLGWLGFTLRSRWHAALPAVGLMFLVAFQEFELASLIGRPAWTVWLFDAQVGGLALAESLRMVIEPVVCQIVVLMSLAWWIATRQELARPDTPHSSPLPVHRKNLAWLYLVVAVAMALFIPASLVGSGALEGLWRVVRSAEQIKPLLSEILVGTAYALVAAMVAMLIAAPLLDRARHSHLGRLGLVAISLPGLFGSLVLSLALIRLLQQPYLQFFYKTPYALALGLILLLLPRAVVARLLLSASGKREGAHLAVLLGTSPARATRATARELAWQMRWRGEFWSVALLTYWAFLDLTVAYLLAPVTIVSAPVMLYNQMHFGKNAVLSALVFLTVIVPALLFILASVSRRFFFRWFWR